MLKVRRLVPLLFLCTFLFVNSALAQEEPPSDAPGHREDPVPPPKTPPPARDQRATESVENVTRGNFESIQVNVDGTGANIIGDAANEPSMAIDPSLS